MVKQYHRRDFLFKGTVFCVGCLVLGGAGCRSTQKGKVIKEDDPGRVGSHQAGSEVFRPMVCDATAKLLGAAEKQSVPYDAANSGHPQPRRVCFIALENKTNEEIGDFKEQLFEIIDTQISSSTSFTTVSPRAIQGALRSTGFRSDDLFLPVNMATFSSAMQKEGQPFEYLLFAKLTSGTTVDNLDSQKDYMLTLEMVNVNSPDDRLKESTRIRKEYNRTASAKVKAWFK